MYSSSSLSECFCTYSKISLESSPLLSDTTYDIKSLYILKGTKSSVLCEISLTICNVRPLSFGIRSGLQRQVILCLFSVVNLGVIVYGNSLNIEFLFFSIQYKNCIGPTYEVLTWRVIIRNLVVIVTMLCLGTSTAGAKFIPVYIDIDIICKLHLVLAPAWRGYLLFIYHACGQLKR